MKIPEFEKWEVGSDAAEWVGFWMRKEEERRSEISGENLEAKESNWLIYGCSWKK